MAKFNESKVINALHADKAEIGKRYWHADNLVRLKDDVECSTTDFITLKEIGHLRFEKDYLIIQHDDKKRGIIELMEYLNAPLEDVVVFGDDTNDLIEFIGANGEQILDYNFENWSGIRHENSKRDWQTA